ncbi:MAG: hypothetical protein JWO08_532 [Verrucomicrobiaceae bacterium]|nr:hypothetical protein [Verrucomicrobiaceae bacterium]
MAIRIGISGWTYSPWRGVFYPKDLTHKRELEYASRKVRTIEINGSFYSLQRPESYQAWYDATPADFVFSVKGGRFITHIKRLRDVELPLANFFASGVLALGEKLGPFLWQLPPSFRYDKATIETFAQLLPRTMTAAVQLAKKHDSHLKRDACLKAKFSGPLRHALEVRHTSFVSEDFVNLLREHDIGLVVADTAGKWPYMEDETSDFIYVRLHGDEELYASGYGDAALTRWAAKIRSWSKGKTPVHSKLVAKRAAITPSRDVFVYFDNDIKVHAPYDAMSLAYKLRLGPRPEEQNVASHE